MMPDNVFRLQLLSAFQNRRRILVRLAVSVLLALPFILAKMPERIQSAGIVIVIIFTGFFGAAVGHAQLCGDSRFTRLSLLPVSRPLLWLDLALAALLTRLVPSVIILAGFIAIQSRHFLPLSLLATFDCLLRVLLLMTVLGMALGRWARNNADVHLFGALVCVLLITISGLTPLPARLEGLLAYMHWNPLTRLAALLRSFTGSPLDLSFADQLSAVLVPSLLTLLAFWRWLGNPFREKKFFDPALPDRYHDTADKEL